MRYKYIRIVQKYTFYPIGIYNQIRTFKIIIIAYLSVLFKMKAKLKSKDYFYIWLFFKNRHSSNVKLNSLKRRYIKSKDNTKLNI